MRAAALQYAIAAGKPDANLTRVEQLVRDLMTGERPPDVIALPEMWSTGFALRHRETLATPCAEREVSFLRSLATRYHVAFAGGSVLAEDRGRYYNRTLIMDADLLRETMRFEIKALQRKFNFTIIFVTHDQSEAMAISDRMMVCDMGRIMQIDTPENLYNKPCNRFVHNFLGESTFINVVIRDGKVYATGDMDQAIALDIPKDAASEMVVATRPNEIAMSAPDQGGYRTHVEKRIFLTDRTEYLVPVGDQMVKIQTPHRISFKEGEACCVKFMEPMWYPMDDKQAELERARRQLV